MKSWSPKSAKGRWRESLTGIIHHCSQPRGIIICIAQYKESAFGCLQKQDHKTGFMSLRDSSSIKSGVSQMRTFDRKSQLQLNLMLPCSYIEFIYSWWDCMLNECLASGDQITSLIFKFMHCMLVEPPICWSYKPSWRINSELSLVNISLQRCAITALFWQNILLPTQWVFPTLITVKSCDNKFLI